MAEAIIDAMYKKIKRNVPIPRTERKSIEEKKKKNLKVFWNNTKQPNTHVIRDPEKEGRETGMEQYLKQWLNASQIGRQY